MATWLRDPLAHFLVLGVLVFVAHRALAPPPADEDAGAVIEVDAAFVDALARERAARVGRPAEAIDRASVRTDWIREEALVREARALGLDLGDAIIRRRLVQKLELFVRAGVEPVEPTEADLEAYLAEHADAHRAPPRVSFEHRYFSTDRRGEQAADDARSALTDAEGLASAGDAFPLGANVEGRAVAAVEDAFGEGFARGLAEAPVGEWAGPLSSRYGVHLVRVTERTDARPLALAEVRATIRALVLQEREQAATEAALASVVARYRVVEAP